MFKKLINSWKQEWLEKNKLLLMVNHESDFAKMQSDFEKLKKEHEEKFQLAYSEAKKKYEALTFQQAEIDELSKRLEERKLALARENEDLKIKLKLAEAKSSPSNVWVEGFTLGVSKTWDLLMPVMVGNVEALKKKIYEDATLESLSRLNGRKK